MKQDIKQTYKSNDTEEWLDRLRAETYIKVY